MSRTGYLLAVVAGTAVAWLQLDGVPWPARAWAAVLLVPLPALMILQAGMLQQAGALPRVQAYVSSIVSLWLLALITIAAAYAAGYGPARLGLTAGSASLPRTLAITAAVTAAGVALLFLFRSAGVREAPTLRQLLPVTRAERVLFAGVSATAGICEEVVFRGFLLAVLADASGSTAVALVLSSGAFGVVHAYQRPAGALRAALLGAMLALAVLLDGSLYAAILAHAAIDLLAGLWLARYLLR